VYSTNHRRKWDSIAISGGRNSKAEKMSISSVMGTQNSVAKETQNECLLFMFTMVSVPTLHSGRGAQCRLPEVNGYALFASLNEPARYL
jgi:hypothetical protein